MSTFGGNPWLISPEKLLEKNLLSTDDLESIDQSQFHDDYVHFKAIQQFKDHILRKAFQNFKKNSKNADEILNTFYQNEKDWVDDLTLFLTIHKKVIQTFLIIIYQNKSYVYS